MKVLAVTSSPRKNSNSGILLDRVLAGARSGPVTIEKIKLKDITLEPCRACDACQKTLDTACVIDDDGNMMLDKIREANIVILASPIYFFSVSAQLKTLVDRTYALGGGGRWDALAGKRIGLIFTYGDSNPSASGVNNAIGMFKDAASFLGLEQEFILHASCGTAGDILKQPGVLAEAERLGREIAGKE